MTKLIDWDSYDRRTRIVLEVLLLYTAAVVPVAVLHPFRGVGFVNQYIWTAAMVLQVYLPAWYFYKKGQPLSVSGLHLRRWQEGLALWLLVSALFLPPTVFGHHIWQHWNGLKVHANEHPYKQFPFSMRGAPAPIQQPEDIQVYADLQQPELTIRWRDPVEATLKSDGHLRVMAGASWVRDNNEGKTIQFSGGSSQSIEVRLRVNAENVRLFFMRDGKVVHRQHIRLGPDQSPAQTDTVSRNYWWILYIIIAQLLMVALPEEFLYRGYMLTRLDALFPPRTIWGIPLSWGNLITSILFALTHFVIGWNAYRLSVFFPSLIFGMLKQKTRSLLAPILFHASANIFIKLLEVWYF
ncbi:MAG: CPBP family intramembrane metalloprotease [Deltaproteobacteria bacterium]|nr:MAG: CPBP family intramembrane metalloprotease [Deltaproteobacteria bacterium]